MLSLPPVACVQRKGRLRMCFGQGGIPQIVLFQISRQNGQVNRQHRNPHGFSSHRHPRICDQNLYERKQPDSPNPALIGYRRHNDLIFLLFVSPDFVGVKRRLKLMEIGSIA